MKCCCPDHVSPDDPSLSAYALTTNYVRHAPGAHLSFHSTVPKAVYVRGDMLRLDVSNCCVTCITGNELDGGYPLRNISGVEVMKAESLTYLNSYKVENGVKITGFDGSWIVFSTQYPEQFVQALETLRYSTSMDIINKQPLD